MSVSLKDLNKKRKEGYFKDPKEEYFLYEINKKLQAIEMKQYKNYRINYPFLFVFGLPRSSTTLISQIIAYCFDVGYINNFMARFWLAPIHGIRLSKIFLGQKKCKTFQSDYARTTELTDIHEFGYFWRYWLKKENLTDITQVKKREKYIDWKGLKKTLANIQHEFDKPFVFKNIFGSYHIVKLNEVLEKVLYIYIERDPLDVAISILDARKKFYNDLNSWWSYAPVEYNKIKDLNYYEQIAGQVYYLRQYYENEITFSRLNNVIKVEYADLCANPQRSLARITQTSKELFNIDIELTNKPPKEFPIKTYAGRDEEKAKFKMLLEKFRKESD